MSLDNPSVVDQERSRPADPPAHEPDAPSPDEVAPPRDGAAEDDGAEIDVLDAADAAPPRPPVATEDDDPDELLDALDAPSPAAAASQADGADDELDALDAVDDAPAGSPAVPEEDSQDDVLDALDTPPATASDGLVDHTDDDVTDDQADDVDDIDDAPPSSPVAAENDGPDELLDALDADPPAESAVAVDDTPARDDADPAEPGTTTTEVVEHAPAAIDDDRPDQRLDDDSAGKPDAHAVPGHVDADDESSRVGPVPDAATPSVQTDVDTAPVDPAAPLADEPTNSEDANPGPPLRKSEGLEPQGFDTGVDFDRQTADPSEIGGPEWTAQQADAAISAEKVVRETEGGGPGRWNKELNNPQPDTVYKVTNPNTGSSCEYATDSKGRVERASGALVLPESPSPRNEYQQRVAGREDRLPADEGGHLIASSLGGIGEAINIVAMTDQLNSVGQRDWYRLEATWRDHLRNGDRVDVEIFPSYGGGSKRPESFDVEYTVTDKSGKAKFYTQSFENE
jgi:DNA/RNA non-specific endonuclease